MSTNTGNKKLIRILIDGLTVGSHQFKAGEVVDPSGMRDLEALAGGRLIGGRRFAEWVKAEEKTATPIVPNPLPAPVIVPEPAQIEPGSEPEGDTPEAPAEDEAPEVEMAPEGASIDLVEAIKSMVRAGGTKTAIVDKLAEPEDVSKRAVSEKFDELLAIGVIVAGEAPGKYSVEE